MKFFENLQNLKLNGSLYQTDETILKEGDSTSEGICIVLKGKVKSVGTTQLKRSMQKEYGPGMLFGLASLVTDLRLETFKAVEDNTYIAFIKEEDFNKSLLKDEKFFSEFLQSNLNRLQKIPSSELTNPDHAIDLIEIFGEDGEKKFQTIRDNNLKIQSYIYKLRNKIVLPNENIFSEDKMDDSDIYLLVEGSVQQYLPNPNNPLNDIPVIDLKPGSLFGFLRKANSKGHFLSAKAGQEGAKLIHLDGELLVKVAKLDSDLAWAIFQNVILTIAVIEISMLK